jgi:hypothetical protein
MLKFYILKACSLEKVPSISFTLSNNLTGAAIDFVCRRYSNHLNSPLYPENRNKNVSMYSMFKVF